MPRQLFIFIVLFLQLVCQTACAPALNQPVSAPTRIVKDDLGREVVLSQRVDRVISLAPNITEILFALGAGPQVVGVTSFCDYPSAAQSKAKIGDTIHPSLERILALKPNLVLASRASQLQVFAQQLEQVGIPLYVVDIHTLDDVAESFRRLGSLLGRDLQGKALAAEFEQRLKQIEERSHGAPSPKVLLVIQRNPLMVPGTKSYLSDFVRRAGGQLVGPDDVREGVTFSLESVIQAQPQFLIIPGSHGERPHRLEKVAWEQLSDIPAIRAQHVFSIDADLIMRPGPRLVDGLSQLAQILHPEGDQP